MAAMVFVNSDISAQNIQNGGFEEYSVTENSYNVFREEEQGWQTNLQSGIIKIWGSGFQGIPSFEGYAFAQLGGNISSDLFQDLYIPAGQQLSWHFAHRARVDSEIVNMKIIDLGIDDAIGGNNDTVLHDRNFTSFDFWSVYSGALIESSGNAMRIHFTPILGGSLNNSTGNFIDYVYFGPNVPEPSSFVLLALSCLVQRKNRRR
jgi:hypothetical protein